MSGIVHKLFGGGGSGGGFSQAIAALLAQQQQPNEPVPPSAPAAQVERDRATEDARRRSMYGRTSTNPTGGLGDTSTPNLASKSLLGT